MTYPIAILAGGQASRLGALTKTIPKILLDFDNRTFFDLQLENLISAGFSDFVYCIGHLGSQVVNHYESNPRADVRVRFSVDEEYKGTGAAIMGAKNLLGNKFFVTYGDSFLLEDLSLFITRFEDEQEASLMTTIEKLPENLEPNVEVQDGKVLQYSKANSEGLNVLDYGILGLNLSGFSELDQPKNFDLQILLQSLIRRDRLLNYPVTKRFFEIGSVDGITEFKSYLKGLN